MGLRRCAIALVAVVIGNADAFALVHQQRVAAPVPILTPHAGRKSSQRSPALSARRAEFRPKGRSTASNSMTELRMADDHDTEGSLAQQQRTQLTKLHMADVTADTPEGALVQQQEMVTQRLDNIASTNAAVIGVVALAALYQLLHVDAEALAALWEYGLGKHGGDITKAAVTIDLLARLPMDLLHSYEELVPTNPIFYKACTSGVAYALGDFISQVYQGRTLSTIDLPRSVRSGAAGFIGHGPLCHNWLNFMENNLDFGGAWWATGIKVTADLTVWSIFLNAAYSFLIGSLALRPPGQVWEEVKATSWPALRSAWRFWPFVHTVSFSHAVPLDLKLLWVDVMEVVWVTILSKVANEDKNAKMKDNPEVEVLDVVESFDVEPALEIELTREVELDPETGGNLSFELPKKVLNACWPLIVMWPVLYAGYQLERALGLEV